MTGDDGEEIDTGPVGRVSLDEVVWYEVVGYEAG
jgi:hypothetical protein